MKKFFSIAIVVCLMNVAVFAGWANSVGFACDPNTSSENTCFYDGETGHGNLAAGFADSTLTAIKVFTAEYNPFVFLFP